MTSYPTYRSLVASARLAVFLFLLSSGELNFGEMLPEGRFCVWCMHVYGVRLRLLEFILPQSSVNGLGNRGRTQQKRNNRRARDKMKSVCSVKLEN